MSYNELSLRALIERYKALISVIRALMALNDPKMAQNGPKWALIRPQNEPKMGPKWALKGGSRKSEKMAIFWTSLDPFFSIIKIAL